MHKVVFHVLLVWFGVIVIAEPSKPLVTQIHIHWVNSINQYVQSCIKLFTVD